MTIFDRIAAINPGALTPRAIVALNPHCLRLDGRDAVNFRHHEVRATYSWDIDTPIPSHIVWRIEPEEKGWPVVIVGDDNGRRVTLATCLDYQDAEGILAVIARVHGREAIVDHYYMPPWGPGNPWLFKQGHTRTFLMPCLDTNMDA